MLSGLCFIVLHVLVAVFDLLQSLHIARNPDLRDMASELDSEITTNGVAYFHEEGTSRENFRKRNKFQCKVDKNENHLVKFREIVW